MSTVDERPEAAPATTSDEDPAPAVADPTGEIPVPAGEGRNRAEEVLGVLRAEPVNPHLLRGFGPLAVGVVILLLMVLLLPTVARERDVERPVDAPAAEATP